MSSSQPLFYGFVEALIDIEIEMMSCGLSQGELESQPTQTKKKRIKLHWTDQLSDLVELAYGLVAKQSVNGGHALLKNIVCGLEELFNVDLSNHPHLFYAIRHRKKDRAVFLNALHDALTSKMDDMDN